MWSAFKNDLIDFVSTITEDTSKTLAQVIGEPLDEEENDEVVKLKQLNDLKRSFHTYSMKIEDVYQKEYDRFLKSFSLSNYSREISDVLDNESDVARFYAELVPIAISAEEFWARLFYRIMVCERNGSVSLDIDDDEEEEIQWESTTITTSPIKSTNNSNITITSDEKIKLLEDENNLLKLQITTLTNRINELESALKSTELTKSVPVSQIVKPLSGNSSFTVLETLDIQSEGSNESTVLITTVNHKTTTSELIKSHDSTTNKTNAFASLVNEAADEEEDGWN
mmetsp:Transcript_22676/g.20594  ORF Transcript_22676/g.20594 Transcript_22676/m.20594 type:complete len:283 (+) Transcript_22676:163-1011(+)